MQIEKVKYKVGGMTISPTKMSRSELKKWMEKGNSEIRSFLFSINQPLVYYKNDVLVAEYKCGKIEEVG